MFPSPALDWIRILIMSSARWALAHSRTRKTDRYSASLDNLFISAAILALPSPLLIPLFTIPLLFNDQCKTYHRPSRLQHKAIIEVNRTRQISGGSNKTIDIYESTLSKSLWNLEMRGRDDINDHLIRLRKKSKPKVASARRWSIPTIVWTPAQGAGCGVQFSGIGLKVNT